MKYAIPLDGGSLSAHFGHCEKFAIFEVDQKKQEITGREFLTPPAHEPGVLPGWLAEKGVNTVIAGGMGSRAQMLFKQNNITVIAGVTESDPEQAVIKHINNELKSGENICDH